MELSASKRASLVSSFDKEHKTNVAYKLSTELLDTLVASSKSSYHVDLFISDKVDDPAYTKHDAYLNAHATYTFNPDTNETTYTLNGKKASQNDIGGYMAEQELLFKEKRELNAKQRSKNIDKVAKLLKKENLLEKASKKSQEYLSLSLTKDELITLMQHDDGMIRDYDVHRELIPSNTVDEWLYGVHAGYSQGTSLGKVHSQYPNTNGEGIGIYYSDAKCPVTKYNLYTGYTATNGNYTRVGNTNGSDEDIDNAYHTHLITGILGTVASSANLFCDDQATGIGTSHSTRLPESNYNINFYDINQIHLESYSVNSYDANKIYEALDATYDHHAYLNRKFPVFISAGNLNTDSNKNPDNIVLSPAKAFNVITVGSYGRAGVGLQNWSPFSGYKDSTTPIGGKSIRKPEVSAPGEHFHCDATYNQPNKPNDCGTYSETFGTSFATPWAAAMAADAMSRGTYWQSSAAMIKALVIAGASDPVSGGRDKVGEGGVDLLTMTEQNTNSAYWYDPNSAAPFTPIRGADDNSTCFTDWQTQLIGDRAQRIVISWLNDVQNASTLSNVPNTYSLELLNASGSVVASAFEDTQGYQIINTTQPSGLYTVRVCIVRQTTPSQSFDMGFAVSQRVANTGWLQ